MKRSHSLSLSRIWTLAALLSSSLSACSHTSAQLSQVQENTFFSSVPTAVAAPATTALTPDKLEEISELVNGLQSRLDTLQRSGKKSETSPPAKSTEEQAPECPPISQPSVQAQCMAAQRPNPVATASATPQTKPPAPELTGRQILDKINAVVPNAPAIEAEALQAEKNLKTGQTAVNSMRFYVRQPGVIKVELLATTKNELGVAAGAKLLYVSGRKTVNVRPAGALIKAFTAELQQSDPRLLSENGFTLSQLDFYGMSQRFSEPLYQAERIGKTQIEGQEVHVIKVTAKGTHSLLPAIAYELIAYDPVKYIPRYWEAYTAKQKEPFFRFMVKRFVIRDQLPESLFQL